MVAINHAVYSQYAVTALCMLPAAIRTHHWHHKLQQHVNPKLHNKHWFCRIAGLV